MSDDLTIIYYTSNSEDPAFERKIVQSLVAESVGCPIISVSQRDMDLGTNINVGDVGVSTHNIRRQFLVGAEAAKTKYVCTAESDFLYPKEYFAFRPPEDDRLYFADHLYILWDTSRKSAYRRKSFSEGAVVASRELVLRHVSELLAGRHQWEENGSSPGLAPLGPPRRHASFHTEVPLVSFKTGNGMSWKCPHSEQLRKESLPYWGSSEDLKRKYLR